MYQAKANFDEKFFGKFMDRLDPEIRKVVVRCWTCYKSLSRKKQEKEKQRERLVILGMLIHIHEQSSLASIFKSDEVFVNCFIEA